MHLTETIKKLIQRAYAARKETNYFEGYQFDDPIITFDYIPKVTPSNIHEKFKLYMLFS